MPKYRGVFKKGKYWYCSASDGNGVLGMVE